MSYALLQKVLEPPSLDVLKNAFGSLPGLTRADAFTIGRDPFGILVKGVELERATALQAALAAQGVETEVVDDASLPRLPETRVLHRIDFTPEALMIYDQLGRSFPLKWPNILMIAAGYVEMTEVKNVQTERQVRTHSAHGRSHDQTVVEHGIKLEQHDRWLLEIIVTGGALRYSINADTSGPWLFAFLGERRSKNVADNFRLLVQDLLKAAPQAVVNRGAHFLRENRADYFFYPSKNAFYDEIIWLLNQKATKTPQT